MGRSRSTLNAERSRIQSRLGPQEHGEPKGLWAPLKKAPENHLPLNPHSNLAVHVVAYERRGPAVPSTAISCHVLPLAAPRLRE